MWCSHGGLEFDDRARTLALAEGRPWDGSPTLAIPRASPRLVARLGGPPDWVDADTRKCSWRIALDFLRSTCRTTKRRRIAIGVRRPTPDASDPCLAAPLRGDGHGRRDSGAESCENISETPTQIHNPFPPVVYWFRTRPHRLQSRARIGVLPAVRRCSVIDSQPLCHCLLYQ